jgi:hypothetical protein
VFENLKVHTPEAFVGMLLGGGRRQVMNPMRVMRLEDSATKALFKTMFRQRNLVPVIGAGFSRGSRTDGARVPDASEFIEVMLSCLHSHAGPEASSLKGRSFAEVAEYFLNPDFVPTAIAKQVIAKYFLNVKLDHARTTFLKSPWPYIYTLNIDDAIESNSQFKNKIVPNRTISTTAKSLQCVYKVHGDAADELLYDEPSKVIFSTGQYVRSLTTNISMLNAIKTDLTEQNTLFVGCSLTNEIDLLFALAEYHSAFPEGRSSIYVSRSEPTKFEVAKLTAHGINTVLVVPDYDAFYREVSQWGASAVPDVASIKKPLRITPASFRNLRLDRDLNLSFLIREPDPGHDHSKPVLPGYHIRRDIEDEILRMSNEVPLSLVRGRRYSGKTLLLRSLAFSTREVYLVDSNTTVSDEILDQLVDVENGLLMFDSNSLTPQTAISLARNVDKLQNNRSSAVVAVNRTEPDVVGALIRHVEDRADFELESRLSPSECALLNRQLDAIGLLRFDCKRSMLENTFQILPNYPRKMSELARHCELNEKEVELLLVVAIADKAHSSLATALDLRIAELFTFCEKLAPIVDIVETGRGELRDTNSRHKIISNSGTGLGIQIRNIINTKGYAWVAERFAAVVRRLIELPRFTATGHSMFMFDAINHILSQGVGKSEGTGYRPVVRSLYENLQPVLNHSPDYWLQRAKAVLNIEDDQERIVEGIGFAVKAHREAARERTIDNAEFLIALLYGKLCSITKYEHVEYISTAVKWFSRAIQNYARNENYIQSMLDRGRERRGYFEQLCDYFEGPVSNVVFLPLKREVEFLLSVRRIWQSGSR